MKRLFLLALVCLQALAMSADFLRVRVIGSSTLHHYVSLGFTYRIDAKAKKK